MCADLFVVNHCSLVASTNCRKTFVLEVKMDDMVKCASIASLLNSFSASSQTGKVVENMVKHNVPKSAIGAELPAGPLEGPLEPPLNLGNTLNSH